MLRVVFLLRSASATLRSWGPPRTGARGRVFGPKSVIALLSVCALLVRVWGIDDWLLSGDDAINTKLAMRPVVELVRASIYQDNHPPLAWLLLHAAGAFGNHWQPRLIGLIPGTLLVPAFYRLGRKAMSDVAGVALATIATFSVTLVLTSECVRGYPLMVLLLTVALTAFMDRHLRAQRWSYYVFALLSVLTEHSALLLLFATFVIGAVTSLAPRVSGADRRRSVPVFEWTVMHGIIAGPVAWQIAKSAAGAPASAAYIRAAMVDSSSAALNALSAILSTHHFIRQAPCAWLLLLPVAGGLVAIIARRRYELLALTLMPLVIGFGMSAAHFVPLNGNSRWVHWLVPTSLLPVAAAFDYMRERFGRAALVAASAVLLALALVNQLATPTSVFSPDQLRLGAEGWSWSRTIDEQRALADLVEAVVPPDGLVMVGRGEGLRQELATRRRWSVPRLPRRLIRCEEHEIGASSVAPCIRASQVDRFWMHITRTSALVHQDGDGCMQFAKTTYPSGRDLLVEVRVDEAQRGQCR